MPSSYCFLSRMVDRRFISALGCAWQVHRRKRRDQFALVDANFH